VSKTENYRDEAQGDAADMAENFLDEIVEALVEKGEASDDINNDYHGGDSYHHETHIDKWYDLEDSARLLDELSEYEESDEGLWEGMKPRDAISAQAAYTYGRAVWELFSNLIETINEDDGVEELREKLDLVEDDLTEEMGSEKTFVNIETKEVVYVKDESDHEAEVERRTKALTKDLRERVKAVIKEWRK
jgi:hypothetical protein